MYLTTPSHTQYVDNLMDNSLYSGGMRGLFYESTKLYVRHRSLCGSNVNSLQPHRKINTRYAKILIHFFTSTITLDSLDAEVTIYVKIN